MLVFDGASRARRRHRAGRCAADIGGAGRGPRSGPRRPRRGDRASAAIANGGLSIVARGLWRQRRRVDRRDRSHPGGACPPWQRAHRCRAGVAGARRGSAVCRSRSSGSAASTVRGRTEWCGSCAAPRTVSPSRDTSRTAFTSTTSRRRSMPRWRAADGVFNVVDDEPASPSEQIAFAAASPRHRAAAGNPLCRGAQDALAARSELLRRLHSGAERQAQVRARRDTALSELSRRVARAPCRRRSSRHRAAVRDRLTFAAIGPTRTLEAGLTDHGGIVRARSKSFSSGRYMAESRGSADRHRFHPLPLDPFQRDAFEEYARRWLTLLAAETSSAICRTKAPTTSPCDMALDLAASRPTGARLKADPEEAPHLASAQGPRFISSEERTFTAARGVSDRLIRARAEHDAATAAGAKIN